MKCQEGFFEAIFYCSMFMVSNMDVSENSGFSHQIIRFNRVFHYKPSILGYPNFWKHPHGEAR